LPAYTQIDVRVLDLNDNPPEISVSFLASLPRTSTIVSIPENTEPNRFIAHISIFDRDSLPTHSQISWRVLVNGVDITTTSTATTPHHLLTLTKLNENSFTLNTGGSNPHGLDRETTPFVNVSIQAWNNNNNNNILINGLLTPSQQKIVYYNFTLALLDENDNAPAFERQAYDLNIAENNYVGQMVHKFEARDVDEAQNGRVTFGLEPGDVVDFVTLDPSTGVLRANVVFDREEKSFYEFFVVARDNADVVETQKMTRVKVKLNIIDLNDNKVLI
jgi:hypothetical protein